MASGVSPIHPAETALRAQSPYYRKLERLIQDMRGLLSVADVEDLPAIDTAIRELEGLLSK